MITGQKRLYVENGLSQSLIFLWLAGNTLYTMLQVINMDVALRLGFFVMANIFLSLLAFLMAVRQKTYLINWGYLGIGLAVFQFARLFWLPVEIVNPLRLSLQIILIVTSLAALIGSIVCIQRSKERQAYIDTHNVDLATIQK